MQDFLVGKQLKNMAASRPFYSYFSEIGPGLAMCET